MDRGNGKWETFPPKGKYRMKAAVVAQRFYAMEAIAEETETETEMREENENLDSMILQPQEIAMESRSLKWEEERAALLAENSNLRRCWRSDEEQWRAEKRQWEMECERRGTEICELRKQLMKEREDITQLWIHERKMLQQTLDNNELEMMKERENWKKDMETMEKTLQLLEHHHNMDKAQLQEQVIELRKIVFLFATAGDREKNEAKRKKKSHFLSWLKGRKQVTEGKKSTEEERAEQSALTEKEAAIAVRAPLMKDRKKEKMEKRKSSDGTMEQEQEMDKEQQKKKKSAFSFRQMWKKWRSRGKDTPKEERAEKRALNEVEKKGMEGIMEKEYNPFLTKNEDIDEPMETETHDNPPVVEEESTAEEKESVKEKEVVQEIQAKKKKWFWFLCQRKKN